MFVLVSLTLSCRLCVFIEKRKKTVSVSDLIGLCSAALQELERSKGELKAPAARTTASGTLAVPVFPLDTADKMGVGAMGVTAELWLDAGVTEPVREFTGDKGEGRISLVLGAGNQTFLGLVDLLDNLFLQGFVVLFKCHELRVGSYPFICDLFAELIRDGYVCVLPTMTTRKSTSECLDAVDHVHITGGTASAHGILWGNTPEEQAVNLGKGTPKVKAMTAELGNVTPHIVCPGGSWKASELKHHASHLANFVAANASCNCLSPKVVLLSKTWEHHDEFVQALKEELTLQPLWPAYYPGCEDRYRAYEKAYPSAHVIHAEPGVKPDQGGVYRAAPDNRALPAPLPWLLVELDGKTISDQEYALRNEAFAPCLAVVSLPEGEPESFMASASRVCREKIWGSLVVSVIVHPEVERAHPQLIDKSVAGLPYGSVVVNAAGFLGYTVEQATWGAYPGEKLEALQSGVGQVKNILCLKGVKQAVVRAPFICGIQAKRGQDIDPQVAKALAYVLIKPSLVTVARMVYAGLALGASRLLRGVLRLMPASRASSIKQ